MALWVASADGPMLEVTGVVDVAPTFEAADAFDELGDTATLATGAMQSFTVEYRRVGPPSPALLRLLYGTAGLWARKGRLRKRDRLAVEREILGWTRATRLMRRGAQREGWIR